METQTISRPEHHVPIKINLEQGTPEWKLWRNGGFGGSDAGGVMGVSPYIDANEIYYRKRGMLPPIETNEAMQRGHDLEPVARVEFEMREGIAMEPGCFQHPVHEFMRASLDGLSTDGRSILEVKCPGLTAHREALAGKIKPYYYSQMQHCLAVMDAEICYYFSYTDLEDIEPTKLIIVERDEPYIQRMIEREMRLWDCIVRGVEPNPKDFLPGDAGELNGETRNDPAWMKALSELRTASRVLDDAKVQYDSRIVRLAELMQRKKQMLIRGNGMVVERVFENDKWTVNVDMIEEEL